VTARRDLVFWSAVAAAFFLVLWLLADVLLPFVLGMAIAYVVDPVVVWLTRHRLSRGAAAGLLIASSFAAGGATLLVVGPVLFEQAGALFARVPDILARAYGAVEPALRRVLDVAGVGPRGEIPAVLLQAGQRLEGMLAGWAASLVGQGLAVVNLVGLLSVTPLVAFYLLRDWPKVVAEIDGWLPRDYASTIRAQAREADRVLAGFARGAALVCAMLAVFYGVALSIVGLDFGLLIGFAAGALSFVPYLGAVVGFGASVGMALIQFWPDWVRVALVGGIFLVGNAVSDYVVTPRIVGDRIGVHPLWVLFGFFAGATLFGFVGMLIAVPACAVIGVGARFAIGHYKRSALYRGTDVGEEHP
jgi:predicted PurR-regulated permease PerM